MHLGDESPRLLGSRATDFEGKIFLSEVTCVRSAGCSAAAVEPLDVCSAPARGARLCSGEHR